MEFSNEQEVAILDKIGSVASQNDINGPVNVVFFDCTTENR